MVQNLIRSSEIARGYPPPPAKFHKIWLSSFSSIMYISFGKQQMTHSLLVADFKQVASLTCCVMGIVIIAKILHQA